MSLIKEFKEFISKGNVVDLAVGVIIGAAFGKIVSSLVIDIIMPPIGVIVGGVNFTSLKAPIATATDSAGHQTAVTVNYGNFLQTTVDFIIIAFSIFIFVKIFNSFKRKEEEKPPEPTGEEKLLTEIRDLLKERKS
jgi:large conductance mechanosensitive channel